MSKNRLSISLNFRSKKTFHIDLGEIREGVKDLKEWELVKSIDNLEVHLSSDKYYVIISNGVKVFFSKDFLINNFSYNDMEMMWSDAVDFIKKLGLDLEFRNEIQIGIHDKNNSERFFRENKEIFEKLGERKSHNFDLEVNSRNGLSLVRIRPTPKKIIS